MAALLGFAAVDCSVGSLLWFLRIACLLVTERDAEQLEVMAVMGLPSCCSLIHSLLPVARPNSLPPALIFPAGTERLSPRGTSALSGFWHLMTLDRCLFGTSVWHHLSLKALPFSSFFGKFRSFNQIINIFRLTMDRMTLCNVQLAIHSEKLTDH